MATNTGYPHHATNWKNYQYKQIKAIAGKDYTEEEAKEPFDTYAQQIWINDEHILDSDKATTLDYKVQMAGGTADSVNLLARPIFWLNGLPGKSAETGGPVNFILEDGGANSIDKISIDPLLNKGETDGRTLFTMIPGLMVGLPLDTDVTETEYTSFSKYEWQISSEVINNALHPRNKLYTNTSTCWVKYPETKGDSVATFSLPAAVSSSSFTLFWNMNRHIPKRGDNSSDTGIQIYVEGSMDEETWSEITILTTDFDPTSHDDDPSVDTENFCSVMTFDTNEVGGGDFPYKRLRFETKDNTSGATMCTAQWIQLGVTPF